MQDALFRMIPVLLGRSPQVLPNVFGKGGLVGEAQLHADFLDAFGGMPQQIFNLFRHIEVNELRGRLSAALLAGERQIAGCHTKPFGIISELAGLGMQGRQ